MADEEPLCGCATTKSFIYLFSYLFIYLILRERPMLTFCTTIDSGRYYNNTIPFL